ncbi:MAG: hypothetical protein II001_01825 [Bacteroidales bacterium]|nr:hypothetical protein [Bacteroidales bacterium]
MSKNKDFWQKNFSWMHLVAMAVGLLLSLLYWYKAGQFSDNILRNNPVLMSLRIIMLDIGRAIGRKIILLA